MNKGRIAKSELCGRLSWGALDMDYIRQLVGLAKIEDLAGAGLISRPKRMGDVTSALMPEGVTGEARVVAREAMVVCGVGLIAPVLNAYAEGAEVLLTTKDGNSVRPGNTLARIKGPAVTLLQAERVLLNFLQRLSGIATETRRHADVLEGSDTELLDTRKTTPGYRMLEKYAVSCGGGANHRLGLFDRILLKDNHLRVAGAVSGERLTEAVRTARAVAGELAVEVEVDHIEQVEPVIRAGADVVMFDNFNDADLRRAVELAGDRVYTEASGGITLERMRSLRSLGLDFISTGALIHQSTWRDIGLDWGDEG